ncbi:MAG: trypsin-like peptidase domain-containing protein [Acidobacterium ailaaui]|nr:trypsin-like peptidase domain-containing protein [Pseudacidobacterium ailaaui]
MYDIKTTGSLLAALALAACATVTRPDPPAPPPTAEQMMKSVVRVEDAMEHFNHGTGVYVGNGYVLTAAHVAQAWNDRKVVEFHGHRGYWRVEMVWRDAVADIALLRVTEVPADVPAARLYCGELRYAQPVTMIGFPIDLPISVSLGQIMSPYPHGDDQSIPAAIPTAPGNSGSPVFDTEGRVVGVLSKLVEGAVNGVPYMFPYGYIAPTTGTVCKALADGSLHN